MTAKRIVFEYNPMYRHPGVPIRITTTMLLIAWCSLVLLPVPLQGQMLEEIPFPPDRYEGPLIDTSMLINGQFLAGAHYWDKPGLQEPVNGGFAPYDPDSDPGFHTFKIDGWTLQIDPEEVVQQRILLSPGVNWISGWYSTYQEKNNTWSAPFRFFEVIHNESDLHLMDTFTLEAMNGQATRYADIRAFCPTLEMTSQRMLERVEEELTLYYLLHATNAELIAPGPDAVFPHTGVHAKGKFTDYRDIRSFTPYWQTPAVPSNHAVLYLKAAMGGNTSCEAMAYQYALGVIASLGRPNDSLVPYRYIYNQQTWVAPGPTQPMVFYTLLLYLCDCADYFKDPEFFYAAYGVAWEMIHRNWWKLNTDPEGLFFISNDFLVDEDGYLQGQFIERTPRIAPGASVSEDNRDHRLMLGAAAISRFLRVIVENAEELEYDWGNDPFIIESFQALNDALDSFTIYYDQFELNWIISHSLPTLLTAGWWSNFDRRDDFMGYNMGLALVPILVDQSRIHGYEALASMYWVERMFDGLEDYREMWDENAKRGGMEAADTYRFYQCFRDLREIEELKPWSDQFLSTYFAGWVQMAKGFVHDGAVPEVGAWAIWDFAPYKSAFAKEVTVPGVLYSWGADLYVMARQNNDDGRWLLTVMDALLQTIQQTARGEAGYEQDLSITDDFTGGGEFRFATGMFDLKAALVEHGEQ